MIYIALYGAVVTNQHHSPREQVFTDSVKALRQARGLTQTDLARSMKSRGFPFHQPTVQRIEEGSRPVRLTEAYALAEVLGSSVDSMSTTEEASRAFEWGEATEGAGEMTSAVWEGIGTWHASARHLREFVRSMLDSKELRTEPALAGLALLERIAVWDRRLFELNTALGREFFGEDFHPGWEIPERSEQAEADLLLVKRHPLPARFRKMTVDELGSVYCPVKGGDDDGE